MTSPVDLTNLRSMTDGDVEMEKALFEDFFSSFEAGIQSLHQHKTGNDNEAWRKDAHALKGIALNLGAEKLGELCKEGQDKFTVSAAEKTALLSQIEQEYRAVKEFLSNLV